MLRLFKNMIIIINNYNQKKIIYLKKLITIIQKKPINVSLKKEFKISYKSIQLMQKIFIQCYQMKYYKIKI